jgi:hypothetical protein
LDMVRNVRGRIRWGGAEAHACLRRAERDL